MDFRKINCLVLGGSTNALGQIRAITRLGCNCINIVEKGTHDWSTRSILCKGIRAPHPFHDKKEALELLYRVIGGLEGKPFIFFASDDWMDLVGENESAFRKIAYIPQSSWNIMSKLYNKKFLYQIAEKHNIPYPKTIIVESLSSIEEKISGLQAPYIVKPQETTSQNLLNSKGIHSYHRTQKFETKEDLINWKNLLISKNIDMPVLVQEFIPGDASSLYTLTSYSNSDGVVLAGSVGHKLRQFPPEAGRITAGVLENNVEMYEVGKKFIHSVGYHGLANTEFKFDARDGKFKLMEINTRLGAWNYSVLVSGLNLIEVAIKDTLGEIYDGPETSTKNNGGIWYNLIYDLPSALYLNKKFDGGKNRISLGEWKKSLGDNKFEAVWNWKDPMPFVSYLYNMIKSSLGGSIKL